ncbi:MAG: DUF952 domain-containing protein [Rhodobiaceae bacterium]|nr:DUF952 domain-containing protein [Rhodobiaceae bacterium]
MQPFVFKIATAAEWAHAVEAGCYTGSPDDLRDGFIHFSSRHQLAGTLERHFAGRNSLVLVCVDAAALGDALKWEASRGGKAYPHLYGDLPLAAVTGVRPIMDGAGGPVVERIAALMDEATGGSDAA